MNKILVLYKSKYGATKKYVEMIKQALPCDAYESKQFKSIDLKKYDGIIFAGGIYASTIAGIKVLSKNYQLLHQKKIAVLCVGSAPLEEGNISKIKQQNLTKDLDQIPLFYGRGMWNESTMTFRDKMIAKMLKKMLIKKDPLTLDTTAKAILSAFNKPCNWIDKTYLQDLISYFKAV